MVMSDLRVGPSYGIADADFSRPCIDARMPASSSMINTVGISEITICSPILNSKLHLIDYLGKWASVGTPFAPNAAAPEWALPTPSI
jgi:hypothetical protein